MGAYVLNLSAYNAYNAMDPDITVTPTTPTITIHLAAYEISFTTYQFQVIAYDTYHVCYPILTIIDLD